MDKKLEEAKNALDTVIRKSRVHLYKPIQIAEILYRDRVFKDINTSDLETYRTKSKMWRDTISIALLGRKCTSNAKFQDDIFNAITPAQIAVLAKENNENAGVVEAYIYKGFANKHSQLSSALDKCLSSTRETFNIKEFIDMFVLGYNIGNCVGTSRQLSYSYNNDSIVSGILPFLKGKKNSEKEGGHCWLETNKELIDTTLMLVMDKEVKKKLGYLEEQRLTPTDLALSPRYQARKEFVNDISIKKNMNK